MNGLKLQVTLRGMKILAAAERLLYSRKSRVRATSKLLTQGFDYGTNSLADFARTLEIEEVEESNSYFKRHILSKEAMSGFAERIVTDHEVREKLSESFGGCFCVSYLSYYVTSTLPNDLQSKSVYANHWHIDTLLSKNTTKIMILPSQISSQQGPLQLYSVNDTRRITNSGFYRGNSVPEDIQTDDPVSFQGDDSRVLFARTHSCLHTAGVPVSGHSREQIMVQLNPARYWSFHTDLYERQRSRELTLTLINNLFRSSRKVE